MAATLANFRHGEADRKSASASPGKAQQQDRAAEIDIAGGFPRYLQRKCVACEGEKPSEGTASAAMPRFLPPVSG